MSPVPMRWMRADSVKVRDAARAGLALAARHEVVEPIFIVGCGRSGTTVLGSTLGRHPRITYLNEPRQLWTSVYKQTDIWSHLAEQRGGRLALGPAHTDEQHSRTVRRRFEIRRELGGGSRLIEKLPANSHRISFLRTIFPDARFIHLFRNGLEVAASISKYAQASPWWGVRDYKWRQLALIASKSDSSIGLPELCHDDYHRGLLEWQLTTQVVIAELAKMPRGSFIEVSYADLVREPSRSINLLLEFVGVESAGVVSSFISRNIRQSADPIDRELTKLELTLGGHLLRRSLDPGLRSMAEVADE